METSSSTCLLSEGMSTHIGERCCTAESKLKAQQQLELKWDNEIQNKFGHFNQELVKHNLSSFCEGASG